MTQPSQRVHPAHERFLSREDILEEVGSSKSAFLAIVLIVALLCGAVIWANHLVITTTAKAEGQVVTSGNDRVVQHLEGGIVSEILVKDGDVVEQGQVMMRFDQTLRAADLDQILARDAALKVKEIRLRAQIDGTTPQFGALNTSHPALVAEAIDTLKSTQERIVGQKAVIQSRIEQRQQSADNYASQVNSLKDQVELMRETVKVREDLFKDGLESRVEMNKVKLEFSRIESAYNDAVAARGQALSSVQEAENQLKELDAKERDAASEELTSVISELGEVSENLKRLKNRVERLEIASPIAGIVNGLQVNTPGAVVEPAAVIMTIVPIEEGIIVEARTDPADIGYIAVGQNAKVSISGFDARRHGNVTGKVEHISATSFTDQTGQTYFKSRIALDQATIDTDTTQYAIVPGMTVQAQIITDQQTLLQYLTGPIYSSLSGTFSER